MIHVHPSIFNRFYSWVTMDERMNEQTSISCRLCTRQKYRFYSWIVKNTSLTYNSCTPRCIQLFLQLSINASMYQWTNVRCRTCTRLNYTCYNFISKIISQIYDSCTPIHIQLLSQLSIDVWTNMSGTGQRHV